MSNSVYGYLLDIVYTQNNFDNFKNRLLLLTTLIYERKAQATNLRKKVLVIIGMTKTIINPNYIKEIFKIYTEVAQFNKPIYMTKIVSCIDHD